MRTVEFIKRFCRSCDDYDDVLGCRAFDGEECDEAWGNPPWRGMGMRSRIDEWHRKRRGEKGACKRP